MEVERDEGPSPSLLDPLFTATQRRLLGLLFGQAERAFQVRELMELTGGGAGAIHRELRLLFAPRVWLRGESVDRHEALSLVLVAMPGRHPLWEDLMDGRQLAEECLLGWPRTWIVGDEAHARSHALR